MANRASEGTFGSDSRPFEQLLPLCRSGCGIGHRQRTFEAFAVGKNNRVAADRKRHLDLYAAHVNADRSSRCARIGRPSVRFLDLEQFHANPLRVAR